MPITIPIPDITSPSSTGFADETVRSLREVSRQALSAPDAARLRVPLANSAETIAGRSAAKAVTPAALKAALPTLAPRPPAATQDQAGVVRLATNEEATNALNDQVAVTPWHLFLYHVNGNKTNNWSASTVGSHTFTVPRHVNRVKVTVTGGGWGKDGRYRKQHRGQSSSFGTYLSAPSGESKSKVINLQPGASVRVTIGAGGRKGNDYQASGRYVGGTMGPGGVHGARYVPGSRTRGIAGNRGSVIVKYIGFTQ